MIGSSFGHYRILEKIGQGGMGEVFLAADTTLHRMVALKFLPKILADSEESRERFMVEARAAAALSHPNICVIHEVGEAWFQEGGPVGDGWTQGERGEAPGQPFMAMEYVEGETLREKIRQGSLTVDQITSIFHQVLKGLEEAHLKGIVHRDIKSNNIMVTAKGQAKILDFGLAKVRGGPALTKTHTTLGTVAYMSPEQAAGDEVDQRADLWSAGVVLYEMLSGKLPFRGERETVVLHHILHEPPEAMEDLKPPIPLALRRMVARALEKDPEDRYATATEILADLQRYLDGVVAEAAGVFNLRSLSKRMRQPRVGIPVVLVFLGLVASAFWYSRRKAEIRWARDEAIPEIQRLIDANDVWRNLVPPYRLAEQAEAVLGDDPELAALIDQCSRRIDIITDPPGAEVYFKEYEKPEAEWSFLGVTPLEGIRVPIGIFRWKMEKEGYETVLAAASSWDIGGSDDLVAGANLVRTLDEEGTIPNGMVRVEATETPAGAVGSFFIGRYEVTNRAYKEFVDAGAYENREYWKHPFVRDGREVAWEDGIREMVDQAGRPGPSTWLGSAFPEGQGDYPVSGVSWYEAAAYAEFLGMSLPTSTHWNVARGAFTPMIQYPQLGGFGVFAPFTNFGSQGPVPVGSLPGITAFGAYDMPGNVREWCWNETTQGRVVRGGAWEDNTYEFGNLRQAPAMDRSAKNGIRLASYPDDDGAAKAFFGLQAIQTPVDPRSRAPVPDAVFHAYQENFAYDRTDLASRVEERVENPEGWVHETVSFDAAYGGERVLAHLFLPTNASPPYQTVVYFPGSASAMMPSSLGLEDYYEFTMFLSFLVRNGRAVLYPVYKGTFERGSPELMVLSQGDNSYAFSEYLTQVVKDLRRSIDYLESRSDIDAGRLAFYGMSWGGYLGAVIPAVEDRFRASVLVAAGLVDVGRPEVNPLNYVSRVRVPTLILNGRYDVLFPLETTAKPLLDLLGTPDADKDLLLYDTDHIPPRTEYIKEILAWLDQYLGPVRR